ncbi:MAG: methyl-accepting chemotaxis protein [Rhodocyclaceae bacterium]|nr:methyl-accepting chemotaxis protein [Rhodocyclaceae bacterium]
MSMLKSLLARLKQNTPTSVAGAPVGKPLPLIGHLSLPVQYQILGALFVGMLMVALTGLWLQNRTATLATGYLIVTGQILPLAQQIPKAGAIALNGQKAGFFELRTARADFKELIDKLTDGGDVQGIDLPPTSPASRPALDALKAAWAVQDKDLTVVLDQEKGLALLASLAEAQRQSLKLEMDSQKFGGEVPYRNESIMRRAIELGWVPGFDEDTYANLGVDLKELIEIIETQKTVDKFASVSYVKALQLLLGTWEDLPKDVKDLSKARGIGKQLNANAKKLGEATDALVQAYQAEVSQQSLSAIIASIAGSFSLLMLIGIVKVFRDDANRRSSEALRMQRIAEAEKDTTQAAILRLMNEMGDLADGDLTVRATVSEDITGAIADSVNYTIEELSVLVGRINNAAARVTTATDAAQLTSGELLAANETQAREIQVAGDRISAMAKSMTEVSSSAQESAHVARLSLEVAHKGSSAVAESITGMNEIRGQIQETAKRIKRLGESSQEIGEIVELISDITEQTNVLALNAAIQAASAGEAGRGFSVVAEEVQRLAERSGEATKQIAALVKTIQTDTYDAVTAMENSTQNVVEGAKRSDAAGQALTEISSVTQKLAQLIESISAATQEQSVVASGVAHSMEGILHVTDQTTTGTQQTAVSIGELAALAVELKGSVSGFRV